MDRALEFFLSIQEACFHEGERLGQQHRRDVLLRIEPEMGVQDARPELQPGRPHSRNVLRDAYYSYAVRLFASGEGFTSGRNLSRCGFQPAYFNIADLIGEQGGKQRPERR